MFGSQWYPSHNQNPTVMPEGEDGCLETTKIPKAASRLRRCEFGGGSEITPLHKVSGQFMK